jgi:hypothetical protein
VNKRVNLLFIIALFFSAVEVHADWKKYESDSFVIISDERERSVIKWANDLETVRSLAELLFQVRAPTASESKLIIFIFNKNKDYSDLLDTSNVAGFYYQGINQPYIVIGPRSQQEVLFHEFTHYLTSYRSNAQTPTWLEEALAETLSTVSVNFDEVKFGGAPNRISGFGTHGGRPIPLARLLSDIYETDRTKANAYYATAWVFYKLIWMSDDEDLDAAFSNYLEVYRSGERDPEILAGSFSTYLDDMDQRISLVARRPRGTVLELIYELPLNKVRPETIELKKTDLTDNDFYTAIAPFLLDIKNYDKINQFLNPENSRDRPLSNAFYALARDETLSIERDYMENLVGITDPNLEEYLSVYSQKEQSRYYSLLSRYFYPEYLEASYDFAQQAIVLDSANVEALLKLCLISLKRREFSSAKSYIDQAASLSIQNDEVIGISALASLLLGDQDLLKKSTDQWKSYFKHNENASDYSETISLFYNVGTEFIKADLIENTPVESDVVEDILRAGSGVRFYDLSGLKPFLQVVLEKI